MPDLPILRDIATFSRIDRVQVPDAFSVFRILAVGDVDDVVDDDGGADHFVPSLRPDRFLWVHIELPKLLAAGRFVASNPTVTLATDNLNDVTDLADRG